MENLPPFSFKELPLKLRPGGRSLQLQRVSSEVSSPQARRIIGTPPGGTDSDGVLAEMQASIAGGSPRAAALGEPAEQ